jgi:hypothetical protein
MNDALLELGARYLTVHNNSDGLGTALNGTPAVELAAECLAEHNNELYAWYQGAQYSHLPAAQVQARRLASRWDAEPEQEQ